MTEPNHFFHVRPRKSAGATWIAGWLARGCANSLAVMAIEGLRGRTQNCDLNHSRIIPGRAL